MLAAAVAGAGALPSALGFIERPQPPPQATEALTGATLVRRYAEVKWPRTSKTTYTKAVPTTNNKRMSRAKSLGLVAAKSGQVLCRGGDTYRFSFNIRSDHRVCKK